MVVHPQSRTICRCKKCNAAFGPVSQCLKETQPDEAKTGRLSFRRRIVSGDMDAGEEREGACKLIAHFLCRSNFGSPIGLRSLLTTKNAANPCRAQVAKKQGRMSFKESVDVGFRISTIYTMSS